MEIEQKFNRVELLLGHDTMQAVSVKKVILFGVGGVGSWCAESLVRSGIEQLTIVDSDEVCPTNINRQLMATTKTVGKPKVEVLRERLLDINPAANINAIQAIYTAETATSFDLKNYDYVIDAIDSVDDKICLILNACQAGVRLFSSMGAALKMDPQKVRVAEFWNVKGCPLAAAIRRKMKKNKTFPSRKFKCVYSEELLQNKGLNLFVKADVEEQTNRTNVKHPNGALAHITAIFGFTIAGLVLMDINNRVEK